MTRVLVAYASKHGATRGVADRIAERLRSRGLEAGAHRAAEAPDPTGYDAMVLGSAVYSSRWLREAVAFAETHREAVAAHPVWLFSCGISGTTGGLLSLFTWPEPKEAARLVADLGAREHRFFTGGIGTKGLGTGRRLLFRALGVRFRDFRDWPAIDAWADGIAAALASG